jgi:hypothetical protein
MPPHATLRIKTPKGIPDCSRCGCAGEFKNEETGESFIVTGVPYGVLGYDYLVSDRTCFCTTCYDGCESYMQRWFRKMKGVFTWL